MSLYYCAIGTSSNAIVEHPQDGRVFTQITKAYLQSKPENQETCIPDKGRCVHTLTVDGKSFIAITSADTARVQGLNFLRDLAADFNKNSEREWPANAKESEVAQQTYYKMLVDHMITPDDGVFRYFRPAIRCLNHSTTVEYVEYSINSWDSVLLGG